MSHGPEHFNAQNGDFEPPPHYYDDPTYIDGDGNPLAVGSRVAVGDGPGDQGTVVRISDLDGDVDDEGRSVAIMPRVYVRFDGGVEDDFGTSASGGYYEPPVFQCDDVAVRP
jgi:hypothetical protein